MGKESGGNFALSSILELSTEKGDCERSNLVCVYYFGEKFCYRRQSF